MCASKIPLKTKNQITVKSAVVSKTTQALNRGGLVDQVWAKFVIAHQCLVGEAESCPAITGGNGPNVNRGALVGSLSFTLCVSCATGKQQGRERFGSVKGVKQGTKTSRHENAVSFSPSP